MNRGFETNLRKVWIRRVAVAIVAGAALAAASADGLAQCMRGGGPRGALAGPGGPRGGGPPGGGPGGGMVGNANQMMQAAQAQQQMMVQMRQMQMAQQRTAMRFQAMLAAQRPQNGLLQAVNQMEQPVRTDRIARRDRRIERIRARIERRRRAREQQAQQSAGLPSAP